MGRGNKSDITERLLDSDAEFSQRLADRRLLAAIKRGSRDPKARQLFEIITSCPSAAEVRDGNPLSFETINAYKVFPLTLPNPNSQQFHPHYTPLALAIRKADVWFVKSLLKLGAFSNWSANPSCGNRANAWKPIRDETHLAYAKRLCGKSSKDIGQALRRRRIYFILWKTSHANWLSVKALPYGIMAGLVIGMDRVFAGMGSGSLSTPVANTIVASANAVMWGVWTAAAGAIVSYGAFFLTAPALAVNPKPSKLYAACIGACTLLCALAGGKYGWHRQQQADLPYAPPAFTAPPEEKQSPPAFSTRQVYPAKPKEIILDLAPYYKELKSR
ncbi:MAG: hypothetical protein AB7U41_01745 [Dongiaceae bacterium]